MTSRANPNEFSLPPRTVIEQRACDHLVLVIERKSRIIMADGRKIVTKAELIRKVRPGCKVSLRSTAPLCSKTRDLLAEHGIDCL